MISARSALAAGVVAAAALLGSFPELAAEWKPFTQGALDEAQEAGKPILVDIFAAWCPVCRAQKPILEKLTAEPQYKDLVVLEVDFDAQKDDVRALGARAQSTLIAYKGDKEVGRSVGDTNAGSIATMLQSTL
jgi:thiol-disulfide isomerase/thioredoxin